MGRPRTPPHLKSIAGTTRKDRGAPDDAIRYPTLDYIPPPPDWLVNPHAQQEWKRLAPILRDNKLLTEVSLSSLANLCAIHGVMVAAWADGQMPMPSVMAQYRHLCTDFGLTPLSQGRIKAPGDATPSNPFANNGQRRA